MTDNITPQEMALAKIEGETARAPWDELLRFFASGTAMYVAPELDLVQVAFQISEDNAAQVQHWMSQNQLHPVNDEQAAQWLEQSLETWTVVVRPWVLVQPIYQN